MRHLRTLVFLLPLLLAPAAASADTVSAGDFVHFADRPGSRGEEFLFTIYDTPVGDPVDQFISSCLQETDYMNFSDGFAVGGISTATDDQPAAGDHLDERTAFLYTQFRNGTLQGDNHRVAGKGNATSNLLQNAIWWFENEPNTGDHSAKRFVNSGAWPGLGNVAVLNLFHQDSHRAQDQPTTVPEPSTLALLGSGVAALFLRRRRRSPL